MKNLGKIGDSNQIKKPTSNELTGIIVDIISHKSDIDPVVWRWYLPDDLRYNISRKATIEQLMQIYQGIPPATKKSLITKYYKFLDQVQQREQDNIRPNITFGQIEQSNNVNGSRLLIYSCLDDYVFGEDKKYYQDDLHTLILWIYVLDDLGYESFIKKIRKHRPQATQNVSKTKSPPNLVKESPQEEIFQKWFKKSNPYYSAARYYLYKVVEQNTFSQFMEEKKIISIISSLNDKQKAELQNYLTSFIEKTKNRNDLLDANDEITINLLYEHSLYSSLRGQKLTEELYDIMSGSGFFDGRRELSLYEQDACGLVSLLYTLDKKEFDIIISQLAPIFNNLYPVKPEEENILIEDQDTKNRLGKLLSESEMPTNPWQISRGGGAKKPSLTNYDNMGR